MKTLTLPDYARFGRSGLCSCKWKGDGDGSCRLEKHTIWRIDGAATERLVPFNYVASNGHVVHCWTSLAWVPGSQGSHRVTQAGREILSLFDSFPVLGIQVSLQRDSLLERLPTTTKVRQESVLAFRTDYLGQVDLALLPPKGAVSPRWLDKPAVITALDAQYTFNALQGMGEEFQGWFPEGEGPVTFGSEEARAVIMPVRLSRWTNYEPR
jgi:hypothetical protein